MWNAENLHGKNGIEGLGTEPPEKNQKFRIRKISHADMHVVDFIILIALTARWTLQ